jgi:hypothetical protein
MSISDVSWFDKAFPQTKTFLIEELPTDAGLSIAPPSCHWLLKPTATKSQSGYFRLNLDPIPTISQQNRPGIDGSIRHPEAR